ncbi:hypothetical protein GF357_00300 [Candidatus Dojkabacteria bacterium]|nr:hypothetical protein [Candidatus Dojkabacteria bacterium]
MASYIIATISILLYSAAGNPALAVDLESEDYKIVDATISSGNSVTSSDEFNLHSTIGDFSANPRLTSDSYSLKSGPVEIYTANVPLVQCFETSTDGISNCNSPGYIATDGMVAACGYGGCYDRARFEIGTQNNPADTLYAVQLSTDPGFTSGTTNYIDASTFTPTGSRELGNFRTASYWEGEVFNIRNLNQNTTYYLRISALHGDFTESKFSPSLLTTTTTPTLSFDLDISGTTWSPSSPQHNISLNLEPDVPALSSSLIWLNVNSNNQAGISLAQNGLYGALHNSNYQIISTTADLETSETGFGLQDYPSGNSAEFTGGSSGILDSLTVYPQYNKTYSSRTNNIGEIDTSVNYIYDSSGPIYNARSAMHVGAKSNYSTPAGNYSETITFWAIVN